MTTKLSRRERRVATREAEFDPGYRLGHRAGARKGREDGIVAVLAAMTPSIEESNAGAQGVGAAWADEFCQGLGLDGPRVIERVAARVDGRRVT